MTVVMTIIACPQPDDAVEARSIPKSMADIHIYARAVFSAKCAV